MKCEFVIVAPNHLLQLRMVAETREDVLLMEIFRDQGKLGFTMPLWKAGGDSMREMGITPQQETS